MSRDPINPWRPKLAQQPAATFIVQAEAAAGADLRQSVQAEFGAFLDCGILGYGCLRLRCVDRG